MRRKLAVYSLVFMSGVCANAQPKPTATLIITNAAVYTVDKQHPRAEAVAVIGDRIVAVGSRAEIDLWRGPETKVIDAGRKLVLPGFNDAHVHFIQGGAQLDQVQLTDAASPQEFAKRIAAQVAKTLKGEWILGGRWDETKWAKPELPTKGPCDAVPLETDWRDQAKVGIRRSWGSPYLRLGAVKGYADGSLGSRTAYMFEPFADDPGNTGLLSDEMHPPSAMRERLMGADAAGLQLRVHAIGDRAISMTLDIFGDIEKEHGYHDQRFAIEHAQHTAQKDFERFAKLHVIASMQPYHAIDDGRWAEKRLGHDRARYSYAWRSFLDHGVTLAFGTDWPVAPLDPLQGLYAAVTRATLDGKNPDGWIPEEKITLPEAIEAYTMGAAFAEFQEKDKGSITPGKLADMVILSDNIFSAKPEAIRNAKVETTIVGGKVVYGAARNR